MVRIEIPDELFARLQKIAVPLVDSPASVIERLVDSHENAAAGNLTETPSESIRRQEDQLEFAAPHSPDLTHTKIVEAEICGIPISNPNWYRLIEISLLRAKDEGQNLVETARAASINVTQMVKSDSGYRFHHGLGVSVQGQDANGSWRGISEILRRCGGQGRVKVYWREKDGAAYPGQFAILTTHPTH